MRTLPHTAALLSLALLGACRSYHLTYDYDVTASYARYKTFDYCTSKKGTGGTTSLMDKRKAPSSLRSWISRATS